MATNPIQRRSRQSFLIGFLIALVAAAVVVVLLFTKISSLNEELETTKKSIPKTTSIFVINEDVESGDVVTADMFDEVKIKSDTQFIGYISPYDFEEEYTYISKGSIPYGSMVVSDMIVKSDDIRRNDERYIEYNMIVLPTQLVNGSYIDIRLMMPTGEDYIVLSKKYIKQTTETSIWLDMTEEELLTMNSVIVDSYITKGTKLYATMYTDPGMQEAAIPTYAVRDDILALIEKDPNIVDEAKDALYDRWSYDRDRDGQSDLREDRNNINSYTSTMTPSEKIDQVYNNMSTEVDGIKSSRSEFVSELEGTGLVGSVDY